MDDIEMTELEDFDQLFVGDPVEVESRLEALLPAAQCSSNHSLYPQILSQIALAQAMQQKFTQAHQTLDMAESACAPGDHLARARILLERGRAFMQAKNNMAARPLFIASYELCEQHQYDFHACNAAHMVAIVAERVEDKIDWNSRAIALAQKSTSAQKWLASLYNNLGHALIEGARYHEALDALERALILVEQDGLTVNVRVAKWAVARALRFLNRLEEALPILVKLVEEYDQLLDSGTLDLPRQMLPSVRGLVYEELAEIYAVKGDTLQSKKFAELAYLDLMQDEWFKHLHPERLQHLQQLQS